MTQRSDTAEEEIDGGDGSRKGWQDAIRTYFTSILDSVCWFALSLRYSSDLKHYVVKNAKKKIFCVCSIFTLRTSGKTYAHRQGRRGKFLRKKSATLHGPYPHHSRIYSPQRNLHHRRSTPMAVNM